MLGTTFQPANPIELLATFNELTLVRCVATCNHNVRCRTVVYDSISKHCQIYEGEVSTGSIIPSNSLTSLVGGIIYSSNFYTLYNKSSSQCQYDRYLSIDILLNLCVCPINTFWNGIICLNQRYIGSSCISNEWCRTDLNLVCDANQHICSQTSQITASSYQSAVTSFNNLMTFDVLPTTASMIPVISTASTRIPSTVLPTTTMQISFNYTDAYPAPVASPNAAAQCKSNQ
ncbi:unnamed protein product [Adineta steineri]|uniref:Apple domain-containing protein n=1 Tax=Adineta steineri TaxID=433720 RepID=A0A814WU60_9BILA|nr:unnamed protein product [Adineta steineri]CAF1206829.1 unnamed protein product [Adineta steineri]